MQGVIFCAGLYGAAEGVSYLVVLGIVGWSIATKINTGKGLPAGPAGESLPFSGAALIPLNTAAS